MKYFDKSTAESDVIMVKVNGKEYPTYLYKGVQRFEPNELAMDVLQKRISLEDYIAFYTMFGYSVDGFCDALESHIGFNEHIYPGEIEDYFTIENPLWED